MKEDVKKKVFSLPSRGDASVATCIQPCLLLRGAFVWSHWIAAYFSGDANAGFASGDQAGGSNRPNAKNLA
jgi:hypothetical protein